MAATAIFVVAFGVVLEQSLLTQERAFEAERRPTLEAAAARLSATVLGGPGRGWYAAVVCVGGRADADALRPDGLQRFGLGEETCPGQVAGGAFRLSYDKLRDLGDSGLSADAANGHVDYEEARASLGLAGEPLDFHVRTWPILASAREALEKGYRDEHQHVAYVGAYDAVTEDLIPVDFEVEHACGSTNALGSVDLWVDLTNNGTVTTAFEVAYSVPLEDRTVELVRHTAPLPPGGAARVSVTLPKTSDWQWAGSAAVGATIADPLRVLGGCLIDLAGVSMTAATTNPLHDVQAERLVETLTGLSAEPKVLYAAHDGRGNPLPLSGASLEIRTSLGVPVAADATLHPCGWESFALSLPDAYEARLLGTLGTLLGRDVLNLVSDGLDGFAPDEGLSLTLAPHEAVWHEIGYLDALVEDFDPAAFDPAYATLGIPYEPGGDVFPDLKEVLNDHLAGFLVDDAGTPTPSDDSPSLETYNVLVVGSNVDHNAMTSAAAKQTIRDWVMAGGFLVVFGSVDQAVQWLQPLFHSALASGSGELTAPDLGHPVLHTPNDLDYAAFEHNDVAWSYNRPQDAASFTHVVKLGDDDVLAVSDAGAFGKGRVVLTSWRPYDIAGNGPSGPCDRAVLAPECQALQAVHNFLTLSYRDLYVDYGPPVPDGRDTAVVTRLVTVFHPELGRSVELLVQMYVF